MKLMLTFAMLIIYGSEIISIEVSLINVIILQLNKQTGIIILYLIDSLCSSVATYVFGAKLLNTSGLKMFNVMK